MEQCDGWPEHTTTRAGKLSAQRYQFHKLENASHLSHVTRPVCDRSMATPAWRLGRYPPDSVLASILPGP
jgi:hypothetical protein